jgi:diguanylate cyclase (GGDEF)-like protein
MLVCRIGAELLDCPDTDASRMRLAGWTAMRDLVEETPGLRAVRLAVTADGFGLGPWLGDFPRRPASVILPGRPTRLSADLPAVHDVLSSAAGPDCTWLMIHYPHVAPEVTMALGYPLELGELELEVVLTARSILNQVMLAYRTSLLHDELREQSVTDALTRLANRQSFTEDLHAALDRTDRTGDAALLLLDLDDFTTVNDTCGQAVGDALLVRVADALREIVRGSDVVARLGGDEFALLLPGTDTEAALRIAERIVFAVSTLPVDDAGELSIGAGIGVVGVEPGIDLQALLMRADLAMKVAKARGRGQVQVWRPGLSPIS